jgi:uncharacterized protein (TIGR03435 family)
MVGMNIRLLLPTLAMSAFPPEMLAQSVPGPSDRPSFEVASIKPHGGVITFSMDPQIRGRRVVGTASTLFDLITTAYGIRYDQIAGAPGWAETEHYDLEAKAEDGDRPLTRPELRQMLQNLLADRFQLKIHRETRDVPVYALVVGKNGPKLKAAAADATGGSSVRGKPTGVLHMETAKGTLAGLASQLSGTAGRPVLDKTGLAGYYAYTLDWFPANRPMPPDLDVPDMFQALQDQLGLRLESTKGPVEKIVIDHAEKPSGN